MTRSLLLATIGFILFLIIHFSIFYFMNPANKVNSLLITFLFVFFIIGFAYWFGLFSNVDNLINNKFHSFKKFIGFFVTMLILLLLFIGYLEFYFTVDRSITFRMLILIDHFERTPLNSESLLALYDTDKVIQTRVSDLEFGGYLEINEQSELSVTNKGKIVLSIYKFALELLNFSPNEFVRDPDIAKKLF